MNKMVLYLSIYISLISVQNILQNDRAKIDYKMINILQNGVNTDTK